jgi:hypothetical protein
LRNLESRRANESMTREQDENGLKQILATHQLTAEQRRSVEDKLTETHKAAVEKRLQDALEALNAEEAAGKITTEQAADRLRDLAKGPDLSSVAGQCFFRRTLPRLRGLASPGTCGCCRTTRCPTSALRCELKAAWCGCSTGRAHRTSSPGCFESGRPPHPISRPDDVAVGLIMLATRQSTAYPVLLEVRLLCIIYNAEKRIHGWAVKVLLGSLD